MIHKKPYVLAALVLSVLLVPGTALANYFNVCFKVNVQTIDSGAVDPAGETEDYWVDADRASPGYYVTAHGFRVGFRRGNGAWQHYWSDPTTGCVNYWAPGSSASVDVRIYSRAKDENDNIVRVHNGRDDTSERTPGLLWHRQFNDVVLGGSTNTINVGGRGAGNTKWTVLAMAARTLYRFHESLHDKTLSIGFLRFSDSCWRSSSSWSSGEGSSVSYVDEGYHLVRMSTCSSNQHLRKFLLSHEMGHAIGRLYYGDNGYDSPKDTGYSPEPAGCSSSGSYGMGTTEYDSVSFPEGFAHFVSTRVWNLKETRATINWFGTPWQVEFYDFASLGTGYNGGGRVRNICGTAEHGVTTNVDWLRFYWDFYTSETCGTAPGKTDMLRLYRQVRKNQNDGGFSPAKDSFHWAMHLALDDISQLSTCERQRARSFMDWNAAGGLYHGW